MVDGPDDDAETRALEECWSDSLWKRAIPGAALAGAVTLGAIRTGRLRPAPSLGPWPKVLGGAFVGYWGGKVSFLLGRSCQDKFLRLAPNGPIARSIRERRGVEESREETPSPVEEEGEGLGGKVDRVKSESDEIRITTDHEQIVVKLTDREQRILEDCRKVSVYYFSLPLGALLGASAYVAQARGILRESRRFGSRPPLNRAPKTLLLSMLGYAVGQVLYMFSSDCADRFLRQVPQGQVARAIRMMREGKTAAEAGFQSIPTDPRRHRRHSPADDPSGRGDGGGTRGGPVPPGAGTGGDYVMPSRPRVPVGAEVATVEDLIKESLER